MARDEFASSTWLSPVHLALSCHLSPSTGALPSLSSHPGGQAGGAGYPFSTIYWLRVSTSRCLCLTP